MTWLISDEARKHRAFREVWVAYLLGGLYLLLGLYTEISEQNYSALYDAQQKWNFIQQNIYSYGATLTAFLLAVGVRVDAPSQECAGFVAQGTRFTQADLGVVAQGDALLLAEPVVAQVPRFAAGRGDHQAEAIGIGEAVGFVSGLGLPHSQIRECHHRSS